MTDRRDIDEPFDTNLRRVLRGASLPPEPTGEQLERWVAQARRRPTPLLRVGRWVRRHPWGSVLSSAAAAAALVLGAFVGIGPLTPDLPAEELLRVVERTFDEAPAIDMTFTKLSRDDQLVDGRLVLADDGQQAYLRLEVVPDGNPERLSLRAEARQRGLQGWLRIETFRQGSTDYLEHLTGGRPMLVTWQLPADRHKALQGALPERYQVANVRAFVTSLRSAMPELTVSRDGRLLRIEGGIHRPADLDVRALAGALGWSGARQGRQSLGPTGLLLPIGGASGTNDSPEPRNRRSSLAHRLDGARVRIVIDRPTRLLRSVQIDGIAPSDGALTLRFHIDKSDLELPDPARWAEEPDVVQFTAEEAFQAFLTGPASRPAAPKRCSTP